ncbi:MAG: RHS repeat-associated core domain-containing protein, partial [Kangiellaceae bacterium]|nr:RHS repeat-associated core domain-containing protein [Kangiellaceae bacterium]
VKNANGGYVYQEIQDLDAHGKVTSQLMTNGLITQTANYHAATGQMTLVESAIGANKVHDMTFSYDGFSNLDSQTVVANGVMNSEDYVYDGLQRLTQSQRTINNGATTTVNPILYNYDPVGNFTKKSDYGNTYYYGNATKSAGGNAGPNAVRRVTKLNGPNVYFTYDNNGNMLTGDGKTMTYNEFNKPLTITKGSVTSTFSYGADWMRYKQIKTGAAGGTITTYYLDKLLEKEVQGTTTKYKHYIGDVAIQTKKVIGSTTTWELGFTHRDRLGSVVTITDHNGNIKEHRSYDPFGKPRTGDFGDVNPATLRAVVGTEPFTSRGFTDHEHLDDAELIHMNGRAYDYNLGRFLSVDPFIQATGNSQSMNPYSYIMNNPLAGTDPSGYKWATVWSRAECESQGGNCNVEVQNVLNALGFSTSNGRVNLNKETTQVNFSELSNLLTDKQKEGIEIWLGRGEALDKLRKLGVAQSGSTQQLRDNLVKRGLKSQVDPAIMDGQTVVSLTAVAQQNNQDNANNSLQHTLNLIDIIDAWNALERQKLREIRKSERKAWALLMEAESRRRMNEYQIQGTYYVAKLTLAPLTAINPFAVATDASIDHFFKNRSNSSVSGLARDVGTSLAIDRFFGKVTDLSGGSIEAGIYWWSKEQIVGFSTRKIYDEIDKDDDK